ncbi:hypothetical protein GCM10027265_34630 [Jatrophihabitans fulvus]
MANPGWTRDAKWLAQVLETEGGHAPDDERALYREAIAAARRYPRTASGHAHEESAWNEVLAAIDAILTVQQSRLAGPGA